MLLKLCSIEVKRILYILLIVMVAAVVPQLGSSCTKEGDILADGNARLEFSCDTVKFDTVFTTMGTVTKMVKIYNPYDERVRLESVTLRGGRSSRFRLNVDGDTSMVVRNIEIAGGDSCFVFVRACINPNSSTEPFLIEDAIDIVVDCGKEGRVRQNIVLTAYGRNAVYHLPEAGKIYSVIDCEHWDHTRPHVIMGYAVVDSAFTLELQSGDELYFGNDAVLWVYNEGTLKVRGTEERPVLFTSLRQDEWYRELPGQWGYIWLSAGSIDNEIDWAEIENGYVGILADTNVNGNPTLRISNTTIAHQSMAGIVGEGAWIEGENLLITDCCTATLALQYGGRYSFKDCTMADYWKYSARKNESVVLNNWYESSTHQTILRDLKSVRFENCIIYGSYPHGEVLLDRNEGALFNVAFEHCLVKGLNGLNGVDTTGCIDADPKFENLEKNDYRLKEDSPAAGMGYRFPATEEKHRR